MESASTWEHKMLNDELAQGMEKAMQLRLQLCSTSPSEAEDLLLQRIISTFEKALFILKWSGPVGPAQVGPAASAAPESSISVDGSPGRADMSRSFVDHRKYGNTSKKRKLQPIWTEQVKVNSENGLEGPRDDGYSWRKYGQKDILGAKFPRSYYRCTYRAGRNCWATKQVQRSDDDPNVFEITYKGTHTCIQSNNAIPTSPEKQQNQALLNFKSNLRVNTSGLDVQDSPAHFSFPSTIEAENHSSPISALAEDNQMGTYSPFFYSPEPSESNYFSAAMRDYGSTHASTTNSPIGGMEFSIDPVELDPNFQLGPNFPFNMPGLFT